MAKIECKKCGSKWISTEKVVALKCPACKADTPNTELLNSMGLEEALKKPKDKRTRKEKSLDHELSPSKPEFVVMNPVTREAKVCDIDELFTLYRTMGDLIHDAKVYFVGEEAGFTIRG